MSELLQAFLGDLVQITKGKKPAATTDRPKSVRHKPYLLIESFSGEYRLFTDDSSCPLAKRQDTLLVWDGECGLSSSGHEGYIGSTLAAISKNSEIIDSCYLYHFISSKRQDIRNSAEGTAVPHVSRRFLESIQIYVPPVPEQKRIAEILSAIDNLIHLTNKRAQAQEHLRAGLLSEMILEDMPFEKLDTVATRVSGHTPSKSHPDYWNGGIPWISLTDTAKLDKRYISNTAKAISDKGVRNSSAVLHPAGLVVLSRDARVGCSAITTREMAVSQHFIGWICSDRILNKYLYYLLQKWKPKFEAIAMGSTIPTIGVPFFRDLEIPVPTIKKQQEVADTLESVDMHTEELRKRVAFLSRLRKAISFGLLSGRKRVSI